MGDSAPPFWIGHHENRRQARVSPEFVQQAHASGYDMVTGPITTDHFHSRVLSLLSTAQPSSTQPGSITNGNGAGEQPSLLVPPPSAVDTCMVPNESISQLIATTSAWIDLASPDPFVADVSRQVLMLEVAYAAFCGISYILIPGPRLHHQVSSRSGLLQYARVIQAVLATGPYMQVKIWLPIIDHPENDVVRMGDLAPFAQSDEHDQYDRELDLYGTWEAWNVIRSFCGYNNRLCLALILPRHLPPVTIQSRWYSEPVRLLTIEHTSFVENAKGYPVLSKPHQTFINRFMRLRIPPWILLCGVGPVPGTELDLAQLNLAAVPVATSIFPTPAEASQSPRRHNDDLTPHLSYLRNLQTKQPRQNQLEKFAHGYQDYLQAPLQPLTVNLESITYEVFEKDPIKYAWYERAIARALHDWVEQGKPTSNPDGRVVVAVVGAGRGPLVTRALRASEDVDVEIDLWALEKNPNAFVLLQHHNANPDTWADRVNLVKSDMRTWRGPWREKSGPIGQALSPEPHSPSVSDGAKPAEQQYGPSIVEHLPIDILISELLGSFADNELSPECLDGVQHLLNPVHGISIPSSYSAHVTPIAAPKLHADICTQSLTNPHAAETPYVVMLNAIDYLSTATTSSPQTLTQTQTQDPKPTQETTTPLIQTAWSFSHPNRHLSPHSSQIHHPQSSTTPTNAHNARHSSLTFPIPNRASCHGLAGYFETVLYPGVELSTNPLTMDAKSEGMISWFPIYFPLKIPISAPDNSEIVLNMWRQTDDRKVWYEWIVEVFALSSPAPTLSILPEQERNRDDDDVKSHTHGDQSGKGKGKGKGKSRESDELPDSAAQPKRTRQVQTKTRTRTRVAISELHSSIKEACLM